MMMMMMMMMMTVEEVDGWGYRPKRSCGIYGLATGHAIGLWLIIRWFALCFCCPNALTFLAVSPRPHPTLSCCSGRIRLWRLRMWRWAGW
jgi:hypothetical protein